MSRIAAIALSAAMVTSAFAMSTGSAFAAVSREAVKATLGTSTYYMSKGSNTSVTVSAANLATQFLTGATYVDSTGAAVSGTADGTAAKITNVSGSNVTATQAINGDLTVAPANAGQATGDTMITLDGFTVQAGSKIYDVSPVTVDVKTVDSTTFSTTAWSNNATATAATLITSVNVGDSAYLTDVAIQNNQTANSFATLSYTNVAKNTTNAVAPDTFVAPTNTNVATVSGNAFVGVSAGAQSVAYYDHASQLKSATLTVNGAYSDVTAVAKTGTDAYTVSYGASATATLNAAQLGKATLNVATGTATLNLNTVDAKIGTVNAADNLTVTGGSIGTLTSSAGTVAVKTATAVNGTENTVAVNVDAITAVGAVTIGDKDDLANVTVGLVTTSDEVVATSGAQDKYALGVTKITSIKADNVTVSNKKTVIGAISKYATAGTVTVAPVELGTTHTYVTADQFAGTSLPALDGYALAINDDATVASVAAAPASVVATGKTLTVSGKAAFTGAVTGTGTIAIAPASLTVLNAGNAFALELTKIEAGATAFSTSVATTAYSVTTNGTDSAVGDFAGITTTGYYAVANKGTTSAVIDRNIDIASIKDATTGSVKTGTNAYSLEVSNGQVATLAVQPYPASTLAKGYSVEWKSTNNDNFTLGLSNSLTTTITGVYAKYVPTANTTTVTATLKDKTGNTVGSAISYAVKVVESKTTATTDFTVAAGASYIKTGGTMAVTISPNGSSALGGTFSVTSSDSAIAVPGTVALGANNQYLFNVAGAKEGKATLTITWAKADGTTAAKTLDVFVTSTPVYAYVDGKLVQPTDTVEVTQSTTKMITFVTAGDTFTNFNYIAGNDKVMETRAYNNSKWNGASGEYGMYMNGKVGVDTGVYVNGQLVCKVKVADRPFTCDTTTDINMKIGAKYQFKITPAAGTTINSFTFNTANDDALSTWGFKKNADGTVTATVKANKGGKVGVYCDINGVKYKVFAVTVA